MTEVGSNESRLVHYRNITATATWPSIRQASTGRTKGSPAIVASKLRRAGSKMVPTDALASGRSHQPGGSWGTPSPSTFAEIIDAGTGRKGSSRFLEPSGPRNQGKMP